MRLHAARLVGLIAFGCRRPDELLVTVSVPAWSMPPQSMVMACPVPSTVKLPGEVFAIAGRVLLSAIVLVALNRAGHAKVDGVGGGAVRRAGAFWLLALVIASRGSQVPVRPGSPSLSTVIVAARGRGAHQHHHRDGRGHYARAALRKARFCVAHPDAMVATTPWPRL